jgi:hypothetical protein
MATREQIKVGDLVCYVGHGDDEYRSNRSFGVIIEVLGQHMMKVKWSKLGSTDCWYQKRTLKKLNNQKSLNFYLTNATQWDTL